MLCPCFGVSSEYYNTGQFDWQDVRACSLDNIRNYGTPHQNDLQNGSHWTDWFKQSLRFVCNP